MRDESHAGIPFDLIARRSHSDVGRAGCNDDSHTEGEYRSRQLRGSTDSRVIDLQWYKCVNVVRHKRCSKSVDVVGRGEGPPVQSEPVNRRRPRALPDQCIVKALISESTR